MDTLRGNPVTLVQRCAAVDPVTRVTTPTNPTAVVWTVEAPDGTATPYVWGVDANLTNPEAGLFLLALDPPEPPGVWRWRFRGSGALVVADEGTFEVLESVVLDPDDSTVAVYGPCNAWINAEDVRAASDGTISEDDAWKLETAASIGSTAMWDLTGRQFSGVCEVTVRPCRRRCPCFTGAGFYGILSAVPWYWSADGYWYDDSGEHCGCAPLSTVPLWGDPVREILDVTIDGDVVDPSGYRLDSRRNLVRLAAADGTPRFWPACQPLDRADDAVGAFAVRYSWGIQPPEVGKRGAAAIAWEVYKDLANLDCRLPTKATRVTRQGITIEKAGMTIADAWKSGSTGLPLVDLAIATLNPTGMRRAPAVFSPDLPRPARHVGQ